MLTLTGTATPADYQTALRSVTYRNTSDNPSTLTRTISFQVRDGATPANLSNVQSARRSPSPPSTTPRSPTTRLQRRPRDRQHEPGRQRPERRRPGPQPPQKTISGDILDGDTDVDGPGPLTVTPGTITTNDGGSVTIEADGDFTVPPDSANSCADTSDFFDYTV